MTIRCIDAGKVPYFRSQSLYHGIGHSLEVNSPNTIVITTPGSSYICVGNFQDPDLEIDRQFCEENNLPIIRRQTGGGAVYIDENQLFIQWIFHPKALPAKVDERFRMFIEPLIQTHKFFGIDAYFHPVNDVHVNGKKIVGTGAASIGDSEVVTGNFLFGFDHDLMANALKLPHASLRQNVFDSMVKYVTTIDKEGGSCNQSEWKDKYLEKCNELFGWTIHKEALTPSELKAVEHWDKKLINPEWLEANRRKPGQVKLIKVQSNFWIGIASLQIESQTGYIQVGMKDNIIEFAQLQGFDGLAETAKIENVLTGVEIDSKKIIERFDSMLKADKEFELMIEPDEWSSLILQIGREKNRFSGN